MQLIRNNKKIFISATLMALVISVMWHYLPRVWANSSDSVRKWGWSGQIDTTPSNYGTLYGLGWLSTNCLNDFDNDGTFDSQCGANNVSNYGLHVNINNTNTKNRLISGNPTFDGVDDYLQGCAWSGIYGWVCFSQQSKGATVCSTTDPTYGLTTSITGGICRDLNVNGVTIEKLSGVDVFYLKSVASGASGSTVLEKNANTVNNYPDARAAVLNLSQPGNKSRAYIGFPADFTTASERVYPSGDVVGCFACRNLPNLPYLDSCKGCYLTNDGYTDATLAPNPNILCVNCSECEVSGASGGSCSNTATRCRASSCTCYKRGGVVVNYYPTCSNTGEYCITDGNCTNGTCDYNRSTAELCGWGYNAWEETPTKTSGFGWIAFNPIVYGSARPFTQAKQGSIYSESNILSYLAPPQGQTNATYLIDSKGRITRWSSENVAKNTTDDSLVRPFLPNAPTFLGYDAASGRSTSTIGSIDWKGISGNLGRQTVNKYGVEVVRVPADSGDYFSTNSQLTLGNKVYFVDGDLTINNNVSYMQILSGSGNTSGSGVIFVNGNLNITHNITYESGTISRLQHIPSLVWIVIGDVTIDPSVTNVAGTFIVLGQQASNALCPAVLDPLNIPEYDDGVPCGRFITGNDASSPRQLKIYGNVIAKQFVLQRSYFDTDSDGLNQPAEVFIADGRLQANPPAGLTDFSKSIPRFSFGF